MKKTGIIMFICSFALLLCACVNNATDADTDNNIQNESTASENTDEAPVFYKVNWQGENAYIGIQSVENNGLWTVIKMTDYGDWLEKEIGIYIRMTTGL